MNKIRNYLNWIAVIFVLGFITGLVLKINNLYLIGILIVLMIWVLEILQFINEQKQIKSNKIQIFQVFFHMPLFYLQLVCH
jgi:ABC-type iron transport system FetAB permease component